MIMDPNVWLGTSVEDQKRADERIPPLLETPAAVRFVSAEPLLAQVTIFDMDGPVDVPDGVPSPIHWVIAGGESGSGARPMHPEWARSLRDQCRSVGVPFFFKQWGAFRQVKDGPVWGLHRVGKRHAGRLLEGREHNEMPHGCVANTGQPR